MKKFTYVFSMERLNPGQYILIGDVNLLDGTSTNTQGIWIGDATPYHEPSLSDGGFGWNFKNPITNKYVLEVHEY